MFFNKISTKINFIGAMLSFIVIANIILTIYLNQKHKGDSFIINIAGKQRMLSQKITKEIFYLLHSNIKDFRILDSDIDLFEKNLLTLIKGSYLKNIYPPPTREIKDKLNEVLSIWKPFKKHLLLIKEYIKGKKINVQQSSDYIHKNNIKLLNTMDEAVWLYTKYSESKNQFIEQFLYISGLLAIMIIIYTYFTAKTLEKHINSFINKTKELTKINPLNEKTPLKIDSCSEEEFKVASSNINQFADKVKIALYQSNEVFSRAELAADELNKIACNLENAIKEFNTKDKKLFNEINKSEDIAIQSAENLINATKMIKQLQKNLTEIIENSNKT